MEHGHFVTIAVITRQIPGRIVRVGSLGIARIGLQCSYREFSEPRRDIIGKDRSIKRIVEIRTLP